MNELVLAQKYKKLARREDVLAKVRSGQIVRATTQDTRALESEIAQLKAGIQLASK